MGEFYWEINNFISPNVLLTWNPEPLLLDCKGGKKDDSVKNLLQQHLWGFSAKFQKQKIKIVGDKEIYIAIDFLSPYTKNVTYITYKSICWRKVFFIQSIVPREIL